MEAFQEAFGVEEMKYSIHLVSHSWYAVELIGPVHIVSCYGPENQIGQITKLIVSHHDITKNVMKNAVTMKMCQLLFEDRFLHPCETNPKVLHICQKLLRTVFTGKSESI